MFNPTSQLFTNRWQYRLAAFFVIVVLLLIVGEWTYMKAWEGKILYGISFGTIPFGGLTRDKATELLQRIINETHDQGMTYTYQTATAILHPIVTSPTDPDLTYDLVRWDADAMVNDALAVGRTGSVMRRWITQTGIALSPHHLPAQLTLHEERLMTTLKENFQQFEDPAKNAVLVVNGSMVFIEPEQIGRVMNYGDAVEKTRQHLEQFSNEPIQLSLMSDYPRITTADLEPFREQVATIVKNGAVTLTNGARWWRVQPEEFVSWISVTDVANTLTLTLNQSVATQYLSGIADDINTPARDAKFTLQGKRVTEFQTGRSGEKLNIEETLARFEKNILQEKTVQVALAVDILAPATTDTDINTFGIVELIGVGRSNFAGSPANRRHNIAVGAKAVHGILIAPNEEFSLLKTLGDIDQSSGYKPELVIKGNRTIPEFGGGLCQVGTTTFRAAMASGLPITERQNHSYAVSYYFEHGKPGTDATIYGPHPDFRFMNDTGNYILIQTRIEKNELIFEFWGASDGRVATRTEPKVSNVQKPPATQVIETTDLPPGQKKCTESAHDGMTAQFTYSVTMPDGTTREQVFRSNYRPWQAVCLVGKQPQTQSEPTNASE